MILEPTGAAWGAVPLPPEHVARRAARARRTARCVVFDEVVTGFRWSPGGVQALIGVTPDLTSLAKILAGGLPGGAVAGRADVMDVLAFRDGHAKVEHPGTHNAHPLSAAVPASRRWSCWPTAGLAARRRRCGRAARRRSTTASRRGDPGFAYGQASTFCLIFGERTRRPGRRSSAASPAPLLTALQCAMLLEGVHLFHGCGLLAWRTATRSSSEPWRRSTASLGRLRDEGLLP